MGLKHTLIDVTPLRSSPPFRRLWIGQTLSGFGGQMTLDGWAQSIIAALSSGPTSWTAPLDARR